MRECESRLGDLLQTKKQIRGLTTAATIWLVAAIGMAVGAGVYFIAIFTTVLSAILLTLLAPISERLERRAEERRKTHQAVQKKRVGQMGEEDEETKLVG